MSEQFQIKKKQPKKENLETFMHNSHDNENLSLNNSSSMIFDNRAKVQREREIVKSIKMPESVSKRLKYYALLSQTTETNLVAEWLTIELDRRNVILPKEMI